jgi:hypothetical protein
MDIIPEVQQVLVEILEQVEQVVEPIHLKTEAEEMVETVKLE